MSYSVDFEPIGRRLTCKKGETVLEAAQQAGILINATCGGVGDCGNCVIRVMSGDVSKPTNIELEHLTSDQIDKGWRLACQAGVLGELGVYLPPESLATTQRIQIEGKDVPVVLDPAVRAVNIHVSAPNLKDLRSDTSRVRDALKIPGLIFPEPILQTLSGDLRRLNFAARVFLRGSQVVGIQPPGSPLLGLAVDIGTTKVAGYLVDLESDETLQSAGVMNPQIAFGEDVMARISHVLGKPEGGIQLRTAIVQAVNDLAKNLCSKAGFSTESIADAVVVGNTAMHHLFLGLPVKQLGLAPYIPAESAALDMPAFEAGLQLAPGAYLHLLPNIAGFVGADHAAMLLGSGMLDKKGIVLGMDIGTNTEISLRAKGKHYACSTASGPAFEGAHIRFGMRAAPGAIEKVSLHDGKIHLQTIDGQPPAGLCGSGILDLVAQLRLAGILTARGAFNASKNEARLRKGKKGMEFVLVTADENNGNEIPFSRSDVNEIQLAKGAMRTGVNILLQKARIQESEIDTVIIAGAFGTYLDVQSGIGIGMFPRLPREKFIQVGNAAGSGARMALVSMKNRERAIKMTAGVTYVELTNEPAFSSLFASSLLLE